MSQEETVSQRVRHPPIVSDNPETFADLDGHDAAEVPGKNGEAPQCGVAGDNCPEAEEYADGPLDTSQDEANADARDDSTVDGTATQVAPPPATGKASVLDKLVEDIDADIDAVVKPLIESAAEDTAKALPEILDVGAKVLGPAAAVVTILDPQRPIMRDEDYLPKTQNSAEHKKGARPSTTEKHQAGTSRKRRDRGREKGDEGRRPPRKRPDGWKGPWPPKDGRDWN